MAQLIYAMGFRRNGRLRHVTSLSCPEKEAWKEVERRHLEECNFSLYKINKVRLF